MSLILSLKRSTLVRGKNEIVHLQCVAGGGSWCHILTREASKLKIPYSNEPWTYEFGNSNNSAPSRLYPPSVSVAVQHCDVNKFGDYTFSACHHDTFPPSLCVNTE